jgi:VWFA-related protein
LLAMRTVLPVVVSVAALLAVPIVVMSQQAGQNPPSAPPQTEDLPRRSDIVVGVNYVIAATTVLDKSGNFVNGLTLNNFILLDNDKRQDIVQDVVFQPISLVIAVQTNSVMGEMLPKVQKMGAVLQTLVLGDSGEMALLAFDHRVRSIEGFTSDYKKISDGMKKLTLGASSARLNDAAMEGIRMLRNRPQDRRRVLLLITESRDSASEARAKDVLLEAQFANVLIYTIDISHLMTSLTSRAQPPRPDPIPPEAHHLPTGQVATPTYESQINTGNAIPLFAEAFRGVRGIFVDNPAELYTKWTGGREYGFTTQRSLESAISDLGNELHSQYLLSYSPTNLKEPGYHTIRVQVNVPSLKIRTRPGYWVAARPE